MNMNANVRPQLFNDVLWVAGLETATDLIWTRDNPDAFKQFHNLARYHIPATTIAAEIAPALRNLARLMLADDYVTIWRNNLEEEFDRAGMARVEIYLKSMVEPRLMKNFPGIPLSIKQFLGMARQHVSWYATQRVPAKA